MDHQNQYQNDQKTLYKGIRRRKWGKWVSEIRVPGTTDRLWLGSYSTPEAAAVAHDVAFYCLRKPSSSSSMQLCKPRLNFPDTLGLYIPPVDDIGSMSPKSIQRAASDAAMAVDAQMVGVETYNDRNDNVSLNDGDVKFGDDEEFKHGNEELSISVEDYL